MAIQFPKRVTNATRTDVSSKPGVIGTIVTILTEAKRRKQPVSQDQIVGMLAHEFPKRDPDGMRVTVRSQLSRLPIERKFNVKKQFDDSGVRLYRAA